jgi:hypothetical protein
VNGGTKLQELPEIKNCVTGATPNGQKGKVFHSRYAVVEKSYKSLEKTGSPTFASWRLCASIFLFSQRRKAYLPQARQDSKKASKVKPLRLGAMPAVDRLCVSTFFTHKGEKQTSQLKPLRLSAFARVLFLFS